MAEFLFSQCQMSVLKMDALLDLWASSFYPYQAQPPFSNHCHLYQTIDATTIGNVKWQCFSAGYTGEIPSVNPPPWMLMFGSKILAKLLNKFLGTHLSQMRLICSHSTNIWQRIRPDNTKILCLKNGLGNRQYVLFFCVSHMDLTDTGYHFQRQEHTWQHICTHHTWERQNHCIGCHGKQWILSPVHVSQKHP